MRSNASTAIKPLGFGLIIELREDSCEIPAAHPSWSACFILLSLAVAALAPGQSRAATLTTLLSFNGTNGATRSLV
jgi:hypothetical protein